MKRISRIGILAFLLSLYSMMLSAQINVPIVMAGKGSYGNGTPFDLVLNTWGSNGNWAVWDQLMALHNKWPAKWKVAVADTNTRSIPTNDEWTKALFQQNGLYGGMIWGFPANLSLLANGTQVFFPNAWSSDGSSMDAGWGIEIEPTASHVMTATKCTITDWSDWLTNAQLSDGANKMDVAFGHGFPFIWFTPNYNNPTVHVWDSPFTTDGVTPITKWPFTGDHFVGMASGRMFAIFLPPNTTVSMGAGNNFTFNFAGADKYFVVGLLNKASELDSLYKYAYIKPVKTNVSWAYNQSAATMNVNWKINAVNLKGGASTSVLQGFLPHQYQRTLACPAFDGITYLTPKGTMKCAIGNSFNFSYRFTGMVPNFPAPKRNAADKYPFDSTVLANMITAQVPKTAMGTDIYWGLKPLHSQAKYAAIAAETHHPSAQILKDKVKAAFKDWLTYTPGETSHAFYRYDDASHLGAIVGFDPGGYSATFTDHDMCYGYMMYAAATYAMKDSTFLNDYGPMLRLLAKHIDNWERNDNKFPFLRLLDPWNGHSWAGGNSGDDVESVSECMQFASGMFLLGEEMGDVAMRDAGAFVYSTMSRAYDQYIRDVDQINFAPAFTAVLPVAAKINNSGPALGNYVGNEYLYAINWIPYAPGMNFLFSDTTAARRIYNRYMAKYGGNINTWGGDFINNYTQYIQGFDRNLAIQTYHDYYTNHQSSDLNGITYYYIYSANTLGQIDWTHWTSAPTSQVYYNPTTKKYTYVAYNPTNKETTVTAYNNGAIVGTFKVPPFTTVSTQLDAVLSGIKITAPADIVKTAATIQLTASGIDQYGASINLVSGVTWKVLIGGGTINASGLYAAPATVSDSVVVQATSGTLVATYKLKVNDLRRATTLTLSPAYTRIPQGAPIYYDAKILDQYGVAFPPAGLVWSVSGGGTINQSGAFVSDNTVGTFTVTATLGDLSYKATIVVYVPVTFTDNIAQGRASYTDNFVGGNNAAAANDGNTGTRWETTQKAADGNAMHWWYVKLDTVYDVAKVQIVWDGAAAADYAIQASADGTKWTTVDSTSTGAWGQTDNFDLSLKAVRTQYLRVWCYIRATDYGYSIVEFRAYGAKAKKPLPLQTIVINPGIAEVKVGKTLTFSQIGLDANGALVTNTGTWSTTGGGTINASGVFTATTAGTFTIKYQSGAISSTVTIKVVGDYATGVVDPQPLTTELIEIMPNPTTDFITISLEVPSATAYIVDITGKIASITTVKADSNTIAVSGLNAGLYIVQIVTDTTVKTGKFVKQ